MQVFFALKANVMTKSSFLIIFNNKWNPPGTERTLSWNLYFSKKKQNKTLKLSKLKETWIQHFISCSCGDYLKYAKHLLADGTSVISSNWNSWEQDFENDAAANSPVAMETVCFCPAGATWGVGHLHSVQWRASPQRWLVELPQHSLSYGISSIKCRVRTVAQTARFLPVSQGSVQRQAH